MPYTDPITEARIEKLHPKLREEAHRIFNVINNRVTGKARCRFTFTYRTFKEQEAIFAQGRTKPGKIVSNARPGLSYHNYGLAIDIALIIDKDGNGTYETSSWDMVTDFDQDGKKDWLEIVQVFKEFGWEWGGDWSSFKDYPHFQKTFGHSVRVLLDLHNKGKVDKEGYVLI